jgi:hypothetical protein
MPGDIAPGLPPVKPRFGLSGEAKAKHAKVFCFFFSKKKTLPS